MSQVQQQAMNVPDDSLHEQPEQVVAPRLTSAADGTPQDMSPREVLAQIFTAFKYLVINIAFFAVGVAWYTTTERLPCDPMPPDDPGCTRPWTVVEAIYFVMVRERYLLSPCSHY